MHKATRNYELKLKSKSENALATVNTRSKKDNINILPKDPMVSTYEELVLEKTKQKDAALERQIEENLQDEDMTTNHSSEDKNENRTSNNNADHSINTEETLETTNDDMEDLCLPLPKFENSDSKVFSLKKELLQCKTSSRTVNLSSLDTVSEDVIMDQSDASICEPSDQSLLTRNETLSESESNQTISTNPDQDISNSLNIDPIRPGPVNIKIKANLQKIHQVKSETKEKKEIIWNQKAKNKKRIQELKQKYLKEVIIKPQVYTEAKKSIEIMKNLLEKANNEEEKYKIVLEQENKWLLNIKPIEESQQKKKQGVRITAFSRNNQAIPFPAKEILLEFRSENKKSVLMDIFESGKLITMSKASKFTIDLIVKPEAEEKLKGTSFQLGDIIFDIKVEDITNRLYYFDLKEKIGLDIQKMQIEFLHQGYPILATEQVQKQKTNIVNDSTDDNIWRIFFASEQRPSFFNIIASGDTFHRPCDQLIINGKLFSILLKNTQPNDWSEYKQKNKRFGVSPWALSIDELKSKRFYKDTTVSRNLSKDTFVTASTSNFDSTEKNKKKSKLGTENTKKDTSKPEDKKNSGTSKEKVQSEKVSKDNITFKDSEQITTLTVANKLTGIKRKTIEKDSLKVIKIKIETEESNSTSLLSEQSPSSLQQVETEMEIDCSGSQDITLIKPVINLDVLHISNPFSILMTLELDLQEEEKPFETLNFNTQFKIQVNEKELTKKHKKQLTEIQEKKILFTKVEAFILEPTEENKYVMQELALLDAKTYALTPKEFKQEFINENKIIETKLINSAKENETLAFEELITILIVDEPNLMKVISNFKMIVYLLCRKIICVV